LGGAPLVCVDSKFFYEVLDLNLLFRIQLCVDALLFREGDLVEALGVANRSGWMFAEIAALMEAGRSLAA
jgi:hypothetical protein